MGHSGDLVSACQLEHMEKGTPYDQTANKQTKQKKTKKQESKQQQGQQENKQTNIELIRQPAKVWLLSVCWESTGVHNYHQAGICTSIHNKTINELT